MIDSAINPQDTPSRSCRWVGCAKSNLTQEISVRARPIFTVEGAAQASFLLKGVAVPGGSVGNPG
jgi:hypothetical protein